jgi:hypothetical protein
MTDKDVRLDLDKPPAEDDPSPEAETKMEAADELAQEIEQPEEKPEEPEVEPIEEVEADAKKSVEPESDAPASSVCEACQGTGLKDFEMGREAQFTCPVCNGSGSI